MAKGMGRAAPVALLLFILCLAQPLAAAGPATRWVGTWAASQQIPEDRNTLPDADLTDTTLRQIIRISTGGKRIRIRLSNAFGTQPLLIDAVHVARAAKPGTAALAPGGRTVTFDGQASVLIPSGAEYWSDPIDFAVPPLAPLAVTIHLPGAPARQTSHPGSRSTSFYVHGNHVADADLPGARTIEHWYQLAGIEVETADRAAGAIVAFGDSITDGHGATTNGDDRWPDVLADRLQANPRTRHISVLNHGLGGNRLLNDGLGPNGLSRIDRDILGQAGVTHVIVLEGVNDLGALTREKPSPPEEHAEIVRRAIAAYAQIVARARAFGIKAIGATILPYGNSDFYHPGVIGEADRQAINAWIRAPGHFDAVVDFDKVVRDPAKPDRMLPAYDSGDGLHPSAAGFKAMAEAIPLSLFGG